MKYTRRKMLQSSAATAGLVAVAGRANAQLPKSAVEPDFKVSNGRIRQYQDVIGHYHTAGNPGRGELDERQEINYPAIMRAIVETRYQGFVAQEFIPTWNDRAAALRHGAKVCDV